MFIVQDPCVLVPWRSSYMPQPAYTLSGDYGNITIETLGFSISSASVLGIVLFCWYFGWAGHCARVERQQFKTKCKHQHQGKTLLCVIFTFLLPLYFTFLLS